MPSFLEEEGPVGLIARLVSSEALINERLALPKANRVAFEFDCIDARLSVDEALETISDRADRTRLAVLKILTTAENFQRLANVDEFGDGQWYRITLRRRKSTPGPWVWASSLGDAGYDEVIPLALDQIRFLFAERDLPIRPVGAAVGDERAAAQAIAEAGRFPSSAIGKSPVAKKLLNKLGAPYRIVVRDVGQASFCSALDQHGNELFHLDAGWPISVNLKTAASKPTLKTNGVPVILSHWDWDHFHGYHAIPGLAESIWIVPVQRLGPGAALVAKNLAKHGRLLGIGSEIVSAGPLRVGRCKGKTGNLNQTGLCIQTILQSSKTVLIVGDADYDLVPPKMKSKPNTIVATHHGAKFGGSTVSPFGGKGYCVVSVGKGNGYKHPSDAAIISHTAAGWLMSFTCERDVVSRGNRYLGP